MTGVAGDKDALGYFGFAYLEENLDKIKAVAVDSGAGCVEPSAANVNSGTYKPLARPLFIYPSKAALARPEMLAFVQYYLDNVNSYPTSRVHRAARPPAGPKAAWAAATTALITPTLSPPPGRAGKADRATTRREELTPHMQHRARSDGPDRSPGDPNASSRPPGPGGQRRNPDHGRDRRGAAARGGAVLRARQLASRLLLLETRWSASIEAVHLPASSHALVSGTLLVATIAPSSLAVPLGLLAAVYLAEYASSRTRTVVKPVLETLGGIPTIVLGFFALHLPGPLLLKLFLDVGTSDLLAAGLGAGCRGGIITHRVDLRRDAMRAVPTSLREGGVRNGRDEVRSRRKIDRPGRRSRGSWRRSFSPCPERSERPWPSCSRWASTRA